MFINLKEAGETDVNNGSGIGAQPGDASVISGIQFGDPSDLQSGKNILQDAKSISLTMNS